MDPKGKSGFFIAGMIAGAVRNNPYRRAVYELTRPVVLHDGVRMATAQDARIKELEVLPV